MKVHLEAIKIFNFNSYLLNVFEITFSFILFPMAIKITRNLFYFLTFALAVHPFSFHLFSPECTNFVTDSEVFDDNRNDLAGAASANH